MGTRIRSPIGTVSEGIEFDTSDSSELEALRTPY
jgi:hypothetical protein